MKPDLTGYGHLSAGPSKSSGKTIDEWEFSPPSDGQRHTITVKMIRKSGGKLTFKATSPCLKDAIEDSDIDQLREKVTQRFQQRDALERQLEWEDWIEIVVEGTDTGYQEQSSAQLTITQKILKRAITPSGEAVTLNRNSNTISAFPRPKRAGEEDPECGEGLMKNLYQRNIRFEYSYIPATNENRAAISEIQQELTNIRGRLADFMHRAHLTGILCGSTPLLSKPDDEPDSAPLVPVACDAAG